MLPGTGRKQGFSCDTYGQKEIASRRTVGWVVTKAAELMSHALNHDKTGACQTWVRRIQAFEDMNDPTCTGAATYNISLFFSVFLPTLYSHNFILSISEERTEKGTSGICPHPMLFYLPSPYRTHTATRRRTHSHRENLPV